MKRSLYTTAMLALALNPPTALANAGTPLMWASMFHLTIGNFVIGIIEGLLLAWMFKCSTWKAILTLIVANYASAWAGGSLVVDCFAPLVDITIQTLRYWFLIFVLVAFIVTLLIESPFFWFTLSSQKYSWLRVSAATFVIHGVSYSLLVGWYWTASGTSMMTALKVVSINEMTIKEPHMLYFISLDGDKVVRLDLSHADVPQFVSELASRHPNDRLFVRQRTESEFDLFAYLEISAQGSGTESKILEDFAENAPIDWGISEGFSNKAEGTWGNVGPVPHIGKDSDWKFRTGFWPIEGISGENDKTGKNVRFSLELPFAAWPVRNATQIFGDYIVAQLGVDQICLLHLESRRIALIARGRGPIVAKPKISNKTTDSTATR